MSHFEPTANDTESVDDVLFKDGLAHVPPSNYAQYVIFVGMTNCGQERTVCRLRHTHKIHKLLSKEFSANGKAAIKRRRSEESLTKSKTGLLLTVTPTKSNGPSWYARFLDE